LTEGQKGRIVVESAKRLGVQPVADSHKPGEKAPASGIYKPTKGGTNVALSRGDRFPPTKPGGTWKPETIIKKSK
jgi:hypothetical protein